jgi:hypothetical protein
VAWFGILSETVLPELERVDEESKRARKNHIAIRNGELLSVTREH